MEDNKASVWCVLKNFDAAAKPKIKFVEASQDPSAIDTNGTGFFFPHLADAERYFGFAFELCERRLPAEQRSPNSWLVDSWTQGHGCDFYRIYRLYLSSETHITATTAITSKSQGVTP